MPKLVRYKDSPIEFTGSSLKMVELDSFDNTYLQLWEVTSTPTKYVLEIVVKLRFRWALLGTSIPELLTQAKRLDVSSFAPDPPDEDDGSPVLHMGLNRVIETYKEEYSLAISEIFDDYPEEII